MTGTASSHIGLFRLCLWGLTILMALCACGPKPSVTHAPPPAAPTPDEDLYARAENLERAGFGEDARRVYGDYLLRYPQTPRTPEVLVKLGDLLQQAGSYATALKMYTRLIAEYPQSSQVPQALLGILQCHYGTGDYPVVIEKAVEYMPVLEGAGMLPAVQGILGETYLAVGSPVDAVDQLLQAYFLAPGLEREQYIDQIRNAVEQLSPEDVRFLLNRHPDPQNRGFLMFQLGLRYIEEGNYEEALAVLTALVERLPQDPNVAVARGLIDDIGNQAQFNRYTIGCLLPLSGPYQPYGQRLLNGIELALNRFAEDPAAPEFKLLVRDTAGEETQARQGINELIDARVAAIIGPVVTAPKVAAEAQAAGIPLIGLTQKKELPQIGDYIFRNFMTPSLQAETLVRHAVEDLGYRRFAILYPQEPYGEKFLKAFWEQVIRFGGQVTGVEAYDPDQTDFAEPIKKLVGLHYPIPADLKAYYYPPMADEAESADPEPKKEEEPQPIVDFEALFIPDAPQMAGLVIPQLAYYDIEHVQLMGTNLWHTPELIKIAPRFAQGAIMPDGFQLEAPRGKLAEFVQTYQSVYLAPPDLLAATGHDTAMILFTLLSDGRIQFRSSLRTALSTLRNFPGLTGRTSFDAQGEVQKPLFLLRVKGDTFEPVALGRSIP